MRVVNNARSAAIFAAMMLGIWVAPTATAAGRPPPTAPEKTAQQPAEQKKAEVPKGPSFQELMQKALELQASEAKLNQKRESEFRQELAHRQQMLKDQLAARNAAEALSNSLSKQFDENESRAKDLHALLQEATGNLGELFGVTRQVAGDAATVLGGSLISAQFAGKKGDADRTTFLLDMAGAKALPSIDQLSRIWYELQREMTETAMVTRFKANLTEPNGDTKEAEVVRIGPFTAVSNGKYLEYDPKTQSLKVLARQPSSEMVSIARKLQAASGDEYVLAVVDPARGALLTQYLDRPTVIERIEKGHLVGYVIISVGIIGLLAALIQYIYLIYTRFAVSRQLHNRSKPSAGNPLGRLLLSVKDDRNGKLRDHPELVELRVSEAVLREVPKLERFQSFLRLAVAAGPLLGLIGTVIGMIITFQSITASGASDPRLMANGIGQAMIATVLGLGIAIPLLFVNAGLTALSRGVVQILDEQSSNLLAEFQTSGKH